MSDPTPQEGELILYRTADDAVRVEVLYKSETSWLDQRRIAELFWVEIPTTSYHLKEIYASGELAREPTLRKIPRVQREGNRQVRREIEFYNLDHDHLGRPGSTARRPPICASRVNSTRPPSCASGDPAPARGHRQGLRPRRRAVQDEQAPHEHTSPLAG
jgi:hypothetical protein